MSPPERPLRSKTPPPEPDAEEKAAYSALADVLENDTSRQELVDQLRKIAATPPQEPVPTITPPPVEEQKTVLENVTEVSRHYADALSSRFAQLYRNLMGSSHKPFNPRTFTAAAAILLLASAVFILLAGAPVRVAPVPKNGTMGSQEESAEKQLVASAADDRHRVYH